MKPIDLLGSFTLWAACLPLLAGCSSGGEPRQAVPWTEDFRMGGLGHPLGTYLALGGVRDTHGKTGSGTLLVDTVNGEKIDPPVSIWIDEVSLTEGERVELKGYESGRYIGMPDEVARATGQSTQAAWQFHKYFIATSIESGGVRRK